MKLGTIKYRPVTSLLNSIAWLLFFALALCSILFGGIFNILGILSLIAAIAISAVLDRK